MTMHRIQAIVAVAQWQRETTPTRPYRIAELVNAMRIDATTVAFALKLNGWYRDKVRVTRESRRHMESWWIPPGVSPIKRRRRGRPSYFDFFNQA